MDVKFLKCKKCGAVSIKVVAGAEAEKDGHSEVLVAGTVDAAREKHIPAVTVEGSKVHVTVGEVEHPMTEAHSIQFIVLVTQKGYQVAPLEWTGKPEADFVVADGDAPVKVYEYCNLHGLWVAEL